MAEKCLSVVGIDAGAAAVGAWYGSRTGAGVLDGWLVATEDAGASAQLADHGIRAEAVPLLMTDDDAAAALAAAALDLAERSRA
jgi:LPPG:FO 2-phospho-L-lactate transferase